MTFAESSGKQKVAIDWFRKVKKQGICSGLFIHREHFVTSPLVEEEKRRQRFPEGSFSFLYLKKIKISKIYGRFENFQNYTPVAPCLGDRGPVAHWLGDRT